MADLGTYHVHVTFHGGDGFIYEWVTATRYSGGRGSCAPLDAKPIPSPWVSETDLFESVVFQFAEGNYSCDCNRALFLDQAHQRDERAVECGETLRIASLIVECPDGRRVDLGVDEGQEDTEEAT